MALVCMESFELVRNTVSSETRQTMHPPVKTNQSPILRITIIFLSIPFTENKIQIIWLACNIQTIWLATNKSITFYKLH